MATPKTTIWHLDPHTSAKHEILRRYLGAWFGIMGKFNPNIVFIDGFCGPGRYENGEIGSPIIALQTAISHDMRSNVNRVTFVFIDNEKTRIEYLKKEIANIEIPSNFSVIIKENEFVDIIISILDELGKKHGVLIPSFVFIDPFGFKGIPFSVIERLLRNPSSEVFINVMVDAINRFLSHPESQISKHIIDLFGTEDVMKIIDSSGNRVKAIQELYKKQLQKMAKFVRLFDMRDNNGRVIYSLFFATNNRLGHVRMKEALWQVDNQTGISFADSTNQNQPVLFDLEPTKEIEDLLTSAYHKKQVLMKNLSLFIEDNTPFILKQLRRTLQILEDKNLICVEPCKNDGSKRRGNTFPPDVIINFI